MLGQHCLYMKCMLDAGLTMTEEGQCSDHVVVGTKAGDCLFLDAEHGGQVMLCFPAHRSAHPCCACQSFAQPCSHEWCMHCVRSSQAAIKQQAAVPLQTASFQPVRPGSAECILHMLKMAVTA